MGLAEGDLTVGLFDNIFYAEDVFGAVADVTRDNTEGKIELVRVLRRVGLVIVILRDTVVIVTWKGLF